MSAYYNEIDPFAAALLRALMADGLIAAGEVDERSILEVTADDLRGFTQCHFFAGIGGWPHAFRLAGWPDDRPAWSGSCPCQPLSCAGNRAGHADERHLWPAFHGLIAECAPPIVFGEQVASKDGREWFAGVRADLEALGYACGGADLCAAGVGAPHIRQRIYWMAHAEQGRLSGRVFQRAEPPAIIATANTGPATPLNSQWQERHRVSPLPILDNGVPGDMALAGGFGNAIVPQVGAAFIAAAAEAVSSTT